MRFTTTTINYGDTIELLALRHLGSASRASQLITLNKLRWPYISSDPAQQLGPPLETNHLQQPFLQGRTLVLDGGVAAAVPGNWLYLRGVGGLAGQRFWDTAVVFGWGRLTGQGMIWSQEMTTAFTSQDLAAFPQGALVVYLTGGPQHSYEAGSPVTVYPDPATFLTQVLQPGDTLYLPLDANQAQTLSLDDGQLTSLLGADLALDAQGQLKLAGGDLATLSGAANMAQAVRLRTQTALGRLLMHPDYGDGLLAYLGSASVDLAPIAYALLSQCLLADPRVQRVQKMGVIQQGDALACTAQVVLRDNSLLTLADLVLSLGLD